MKMSFVFIKLGQSTVSKYLFPERMSVKFYSKNILFFVFETSYTKKLELNKKQ